MYTNYSTMWQQAAQQNDFNNILWNNAANNMNFNSCWNNNMNFNWNSVPLLNSSTPAFGAGITSPTSAEESKKPEKKSVFTTTNNAASNDTTASESASGAESEAEKEAWKLLSDDYAKSLTPSESLTGAAAGGAAFGVIQNPRLIAHPINTYKGFKDTKALFKGVKESGTALNTAWKTNAPVMEEAYAAMQKLSSRHNSKIGLFRHSISDAQYNRLKGIMEKALRGNNGVVDINEVAEATAKLKHSYVNDGYLPRAWQWVKGKFGGTGKVATVSERLGETAKIAEGSSKILKYGKDMSYLDALKKGGGVKGGIFMAAIEFFMAKDKISAAFSKDSETGWKQVGQTSLKAAGSVLGWTAGEALGVWGAAKAGAAIGTAFGPGVGTAIGAVAGLVVGSIGCWAAGKLTHWITGDDVGNKVLAENKSKTQEGKAELLQNAVLRAQSGEIKDEKTLAAANALVNKYA